MTDGFMQDATFIETIGFLLILGSPFIILGLLAFVIFKKMSLKESRKMGKVESYSRKQSDLNFIIGGILFLIFILFGGPYLLISLFT